MVYLITLFDFVLISACCVANLDIVHQNVPTKETRGIYVLSCAVFHAEYYGATVEETEEDQDEDNIEDTVAFSIKRLEGLSFLMEEPPPQQPQQPQSPQSPQSPTTTTNDHKMRDDDVFPTPIVEADVSFPMHAKFINCLLIFDVVCTVSASSFVKQKLQNVFCEEHVFVACDDCLFCVANDRCLFASRMLPMS